MATSTDTVGALAEHPTTLLDRALTSATNDQALELAYQVLGNLAERAENAADIAIDSDDRDVENEALVFVTELKKLIPWNGPSPTEAPRYRSSTRLTMSRLRFTTDARSRMVELRGSSTSHDDARPGSKARGWSSAATRSKRQRSS